MPTWRDWLKTGKRSARASSSPAGTTSCTLGVRELPEENGLVADLYLHANMQPHADLFDLSRVKVIRHGELPIQDLLLRSAAMVTDYTSAAMDFSFLDRPVVYYQFDRTRFLGKRPSHFDLDGSSPARSSRPEPS